MAKKKIELKTDTSKPVQFTLKQDLHKTAKIYLATTGDTWQSLMNALLIDHLKKNNVKVPE